MGLDVLVDHVDGQIIDADDVNIIHRVLEGDFVGRDSSGAPTAGQRLGTSIIPWGTGYFDDLIVDGSPVDPGLITFPPNRVISGAIRSTSDFPDYLRANGSATSFTVLGATTNLIYDVNGVAVTISTDIVKSGLSTSPTFQNTCTLNDSNYTGQDETRFLGENGTFINVDTMGTELTNRIGQFVALKNRVTLELLYCRVASSIRLDYAKRGFFFDSAGNPNTAKTLTNNHVLEILSLAFIFAEDDGTTIDVTYTNPVISATQPTSPATGDYWYDLTAEVWKRYSGVSFVQIDRTYIGVAVIDNNYCIGTRPEYFTKSYKDDNTLNVRLLDVNNVIARTPDFLTSVDGSDVKIDFSLFTWDASSDFESGFTRTADRKYWLYLTEDGDKVISGYKPYDVLGFLRGWYHPYESWRAIGQVYNNASNQFELVHESDSTLKYIDGISYQGRGTIANNSTDPTNDIDFSPRNFTFDDNTGQATIAQTMTKRLDAVWSPGDNQGGRIGAFGNIWYYTFAIYNPADELVDYILSDSLSPTLPTGYTKKRYQGAFARFGAIIPFYQFDKNFWWANPIRTYSGVVPLVGTPILISLNTPPNVIVKGIINTLVSTSGLTAISIHAAFITTPLQTHLVGDGESQMEIVTNTSSQIQVSNVGAAASGSMDIDTYGWIDYNLEDK